MRAYAIGLALAKATTLGILAIGAVIATARIFMTTLGRCRGLFGLRQAGDNGGNTFGQGHWL